MNKFPVACLANSVTRGLEYLPTDALQPAGRGWRRRVQGWLFKLARRLGATQYFYPCPTIKNVTIDLSRMHTRALDVATAAWKEAELQGGADYDYILMGPDEIVQCKQDLIAGMRTPLGFDNFAPLSLRGVSVVLVPWMRGVLPMRHPKIMRAP